MIQNSINQTDVDIRRELFGGIILTGGTSLMPGFAERLQRSINTPNVFNLSFLLTNTLDLQIKSNSSYGI